MMDRDKVEQNGEWNENGVEIYGQVQALALLNLLQTKQGKQQWPLIILGLVQCSGSFKPESHLSCNVQSGPGVGRMERPKYCTWCLLRSNTWLFFMFV